MKSLLIISLMIASISGALYSVQPDFKVTFQVATNELAHCYYDMKQNSEGWNYLKIYANLNKDLYDQHRGAGFLQGYLTYKEINYAYKNWQAIILNGKQLGGKVITFLNDQISYIEAMIESHSKEIYWQYAKAKMEQLRFMYRGFLTRLHLENRLDLYLSWTEFYAITNIGDLQDIIPAYQQSQQQVNERQSKQPSLQQQSVQQTQSKESYLQKQPYQKNCNGIVKLVNNQLYIGHSTHNRYEFLLRVFKTYNFPTRDPKVGSQTITFSSRPGDLISKDDFYVLSSGLTIMQTSLENMNPDNYKEISAKTVPTWLRQTIACHLAKTSDEWLDYYLKERSGTHNNQWVVIDPNNLQKKQKVVTYVQDAFSIYEVIDVTGQLFTQGYVPTYNMPLSQRIYTKLGYEKGPYDYSTEPRAAIYKKYNPLMNTEQDMKKWLLTNQQTDQTVGLAPRYDLPSVDERKRFAFGLTDCKIITPNTLKNNFIWAISGPGTNNGKFPAFSWQNWSKNSHLGMPTVYNFTWVQVNVHDKGQLVQRNLENEYVQV